MLPKKRRMYSNNGGSLSVWDQAQFFAPLKTTLVLSRGTGSPTFTRATTAYVKDFEDVWREVPSGAARFEGARVVWNKLGATSEDVTAAPWVAVVGATTPNANQIDFDGTPGQRVFVSGVVPIVGRTYRITADLELLSGSLPNLVAFGLSGFPSFPVSATRQRISVIGTSDGNPPGFYDGSPDVGSIFIDRIQFEDVTGASNQNPSEYVSVGVLSAPYHGAGVDGIKYFATENGNSVV